MPAAVSIQGDGIAACCCARLLLERGLATDYTASVRERSPTLLISPATAHLLRDVFGDDAFLQPLHRIEKRVVAWQPGAPPVALPHAGWVASEAQLLSELWKRVPPPCEYSEAGWRVLSSGTRPGAVFGERMAAALSVELRDASDSTACSIEAVADGWLFLMPSGEGGASLLCVGGDYNSLLGQSRLVSAQVEGVSHLTGCFPATPHLADSLCGPGWLKCGTAALRFDPVCGEGAGNSIREAILAAATLAALKEGRLDAEEALLGNYEARLRAGFARHLSLCKQFYQNGGQGEWWVEQQAALRKEQHARTFDRQYVAKYRLRGFTLEVLDI